MSFIVFLIVFGVIVTIHEFGHFYFAKKAGVLVREFAIGMGPKIFSTIKNGTAYTIRILPLGGYVRLASHHEEVTPIHFGQVIKLVQDEFGIVTQINVSQLDKVNEVPFEVHEFDLENDMYLKGKFIYQSEIIKLSVSKEAKIVEENGTIVLVSPIEKQLESVSVFKRILVNVAGPLNNFILSILLFTLVGFLLGGVSSESNAITVIENGSAQQAGIKTGDKIVAVNQTQTNKYQEIVNQLNQAKENSQQTVVLTIINQESNQQTIIVPFLNNLIGISPAKDTNLMSIVSFGFKETYRIATNILNLLSTIFKGTFDIKNLGGPIAIAQATSEVTHQGFTTILLFTAMLSVNLGVMNLLPIPGLDGGKLLLNFVEVIRRKPISKEKEMMITTIGAVFLIILMIIVTFNDITRWF